MKKKAVIIGAGYGGLALANLLAKAGHEVAIYEKIRQPVGGFRWSSKTDLPSILARHGI